MEVTNRAPGYGLCFVTLALGMSPFFLLMGISALFGANTVTSGGQTVHGIGGLLLALVLNVIFAVIFAGAQKLGYVILRLFRRKRSEAAA
ncbi:hypothetical protein [Pedomonas mirosovicensis]|uniref:hypothetical protein n=1 Tax=Pedomonas mirosovicensis TaxID=2908641 RepID=UPI00216A8102|nr:hypothetical protein [Pedomonas mirosovicensis]MCH8683824.1 hypothetical protein [Pedomonas mirosovicensis]